MNTQKTQTSNVKGFTLVELIVVITILVILGTIAFLNLGGISGSARDAQRTSDIKQINDQIMITQAKISTPYTNMVSGTGNSLTGSTNIAGTGVATILADVNKYAAGNINYAVLGIDQNKFQDPSDKVAYKIGATSLMGGTFELAAKLEDPKSTLVSGIFKSRNGVGSGTVTGTGTKSITLGAVDTGKFFFGDYITDGTTFTGAITRISSTGNGNIKIDLEVSTSSTSSGAIVYLVGGMASDTKGLIRGNGSTTAITNGDLVNFPY